MAFEIASTNLVVELGVILALLMGWQFTAAEFVGGPVMIIVLAVLFRLLLRDSCCAAPASRPTAASAGSMEGHAAMDMSIAGAGPFARRLLSGEGLTSVAHVFVMEWAAIIRDLVVGLLIAGCVGAWVPDCFWRAFFLTGHPLAAKIWGPLIGPVVAILSFVCSVGNVPLAAMLWKGGHQLRRGDAFIFADLLILPILNIYRKYYGAQDDRWSSPATFYAAMVVAGYLVELVFGGLGLVPPRSSARVAVTAFSWNYTTWLNVASLLLAGILVIRFLRTGGRAMLQMMGGPADAHEDGSGGHQHASGRCHGPGAAAGHDAARNR